MKKIKTLKMNYEFKNVFNKGKYYIGKQVICYILKNRYNYIRIGIAINTKLCNAVKRNSIKRKIRAAYQEVIKEYNNSLMNNNFDIVFIWNKKIPIEEISYNTLKEDILNTFLKYKIIDHLK